MRFTLVDRIVLLQPGTKIQTVKALSLAEEYLADHFPRFPVMPGVLMLEAMTQASAWLVRVTEDFAHSMVTLKQARNVRFRNFVAPGQVLTVTAELVRQELHEAHLEVEGSVGDVAAVSGRLILDLANLTDQRPELATTDEVVRRSLRDLLRILSAGTAAEMAPNTETNSAAPPTASRSC